MGIIQKHSSEVRLFFLYCRKRRGQYSLLVYMLKMTLEVVCVLTLVVTSHHSVGGFVVSLIKWFWVYSLTLHSWAANLLLLIAKPTQTSQFPPPLQNIVWHDDDISQLRCLGLVTELRWASMHVFSSSLQMFTVRPFRSYRVITIHTYIYKLYLKHTSQQLKAGFHDAPRMKCWFLRVLFDPTILWSSADQDTVILVSGRFLQVPSWNLIFK